MPRENEKTYRTVLIVLLIAVAALRIITLVSVNSIPYFHERFNDELYYDSWATAIAHGSLSMNRSFLTSPLYAYVLGAFYYLFSAQTIYVLLMNMVMGMMTVLLSFLTARRVFGRRAGLIHLALLGLCMSPLYYEVFPEKTSLVLFTTALSVYLITRSGQENKMRWWIAAGVSVGIAALAHPLLLTLLPAIWIQIWSLYRGNIKKTLTTAGVTTLFAFLTISPATIHNLVQDKEFILIGTPGGIPFYVANHAENLTGLYTGTSFAGSNIIAEEQSFRKEAERRTGRTMSVSELSSYWYRQGWAEIIANPGLTIKRLMNKARWTFGDHEVTDTRNLAFYKEQSRMLSLPLWGFGVVSLLGLTAMLFMWSGTPVFFRSFIIFYALGLIMFVVYGRYRIPLILPLSILGAGGIAALWEKGTLKGQTPLKKVFYAMIILMLGLFIYIRPVIPFKESFFADHFNMGNKYLLRGQQAQAIEEYEKAIWVRPGDHPALPLLVIDLADLYVQTGNKRSAELLLEKAAARYPGITAFKEKLNTVRKTP